MISSLIIICFLLSGLGIWFQQIIAQERLSQKLVKLFALEREIKSLLPIVQTKLQRQTVEKLQQPDHFFLIINDQQSARWTIERSAVINNNVQLVFKYYQPGFDFGTLIIPVLPR